MNNKIVMRTRRVARRQRGLFTLERALDCGWPATTVRRRVHDGILEEPAPRVYRFAGVPLAWEDTLLPLLLSADAAAARRSAAALFKLLPSPKEPHVIVPRGRRNLDRVVVHSSSDLPSSDVTRVGVIPATTPIRTIIDVAAELSPPAIDRLVDRAVSRRLARVAALERRARELVAPGRPGARRVLRSISDAHPDLEGARNEFEAAVLRVARAARLPDPIPNFVVDVGGQRRIIDAAWPIRSSVSSSMATFRTSNAVKCSTTIALAKTISLPRAGSCSA